MVLKSLCVQHYFLILLHALVNIVVLNMYLNYLVDMKGSFLVF